MSFARTVLGDVPVAELGVTYTHEHLFTRPGNPDTPGFDDLVLDDPDRSAAELEIFRCAGGETVVDVTTSEYGRDATRLAEISLSARVNVVAATGHIMEAYWSGVEDVAGQSDAALAKRMVDDLTTGFDDSPDTRAGIIKVGTSAGAPTHDEERMLRAAATAQRATGAPITTHTTRGALGLEQIRILEDAGADLERVCIGHQDHRLLWDDHLAIVRAGCFIGYDCLSKEQYVADRDRIDFIARLIAEGYGDRICLSGDLARRSYLTSYGGGPGLSYVLWRFVPWMWQVGVERRETRRMLIDNPARLLGWSQGA